MFSMHKPKKYFSIYHLSICLGIYLKQYIYDNHTQKEKFEQLNPA